MEEELIVALFTAIMGQYYLLMRINSALVKIKAEFKACPNHKCVILKEGDCYGKKS